MTYPSEKSHSDYSALAAQWRAFARKHFRAAPDEIKAEIITVADKVFDSQFPSLSRGSETGKKLTANLVLIETLHRLDLRLPMVTGALREIPHIPAEGRERAQWRIRVNRALEGLTRAQFKELEDEIFRRTRGPVNAERVTDEVQAQFTQIGG